MSNIQAPVIDLSKWADTVYNLQDQEVSKFTRSLFYGDTSTGKTTVLGTYPKPFIIDADKGLRTLQVAADIPNMSVLRVPFNVRGAMMMVIDAALKFKDHTGPFAKGQPLSDRETFGLDSITSLGEIVKNELMKFPPNPSWKSRDPIKEKADYDVWGAYKAYFITLGNIIKDISENYHVVVTATAAVKEDESMRQTKGLPEIDGSTKEILPKFFDYVFFMENDNGHYYVNTVKKGLFVAKVRGKMEAKIESPTFEKLFGRKN